MQGNINTDVEKYKHLCRKNLKILMQQNINTDVEKVAKYKHLRRKM